MKTLVNLILFLVFANYANAQTTTINATLANPCATLTIAQVNQSINFTIYPNPNNGIVNIKLNKNNSDEKLKIKVYDMLGKLIFEKNDFEDSNAQNFIIRLENITPGIYFVTAQINETTTTKKLIINK